MQGMQLHGDRGLTDKFWKECIDQVCCDLTDLTALYSHLDANRGDELSV